MMNLNLNSETTTEVEMLAAKIDATKRKIRCLDVIMGTVVGTITVFVAFVLPILAR